MTSGDVVVAPPAAPLPAYLAAPGGPGPWPDVVVVHDMLGTTCLVQMIRDALARRDRTVDDIDAVRGMLAARPDCTRRIGVIGLPGCRARVPRRPRPG